MKGKIMKRCLLIALAMVMMAFSTAFGSGVWGYAYLEGETNHAGIEVKLTRGLLTYYAYTNSSGYYEKDGMLGEDWYDAFFSYDGFCPESLHFYLPLLTQIQLDPVTLIRGLHGPLNGALGPGDFSVCDDITVESGDELTIQPGTRLLFKGHFKFDIYGRLNAIGTVSDSIVFTRYYPTEASKWWGIRFHSAHSSSRLEYCRIEYSSATGGPGDGDGGGIYCDESNPTIAHCVIRSNSADNSGGGIGCYKSDPVLDHCMITDNTALWEGGGLFCNGSSPHLNHCTISGNTSEYGCGIACVSISPPPFPAADVVAANTIVWGNDCEDEQVYIVGNASFTATYCDIEGGSPGTGNIDCDPLFDNAYCLTWINCPIEDETKSCCIDAGNPASPLDPDWTRADIGACYFHHCNEGTCTHLERCSDDMYLYWMWGDYPTNYTEEFTIAVRDGEGAPLPMYPPADIIWFMMDMKGIIWVFPGGRPALYYYGLIVGYDPFDCDTVKTIRIPDSWDGNSGLANQPEFQYGSFWYTILDSTFLYHIDVNGNPIGSYDIGQSNITGLAFDADNNHLWCIQSGAPDMFLEYDVNAVPVLIQSVTVPWETLINNSAAGLEYDEDFNVLTAVNKNTKTLECFCDLDPAGVCGVSWQSACTTHLGYPPNPWGIATVKRLEELFVADNTTDGPYPLDVYEYPCDSCEIIPIPPVIEHEHHTDVTDNFVHITARVLDCNDDYLTVTLYYADDQTHTWNSLAMTPVPDCGDLYEATIPDLRYCCRYDYYFSAFDGVYTVILPENAPTDYYHTNILEPALEINYDNGSDYQVFYFERWWGRNAVRFTPPYYPYYLGGAKLMIANMEPDDDHQDIVVEVFDDNGTDNLPGTLLYGSDETGTSWNLGVDACDDTASASWIYAKFCPCVKITEGDFYIAVRNLDDSESPEMEAFFYDDDGPSGTSYPDYRSYVFYPDGTPNSGYWILDTLEFSPGDPHSDLMLRAIECGIESPRDLTINFIDSTGNVKLNWDSSVACCFNVYRSIEDDPYDWPLGYVLIARCVQPPYSDAVGMNTKAFYVVEGTCHPTILEATTNKSGAILQSSNKANRADGKPQIPKH